MTTATLDRTDHAAPSAEPPPRDQPRWVRPSVFALLAFAAVLYLWNLSASGYGNEFYAAATQAGSKDWVAWLFGSLDPGGAITVDKPPAFLWVSGLAARIFGFSSWTVLAPQAIEGVAAVGLLYLTVRRTSGYAAGLLSAAALAGTPVAVLMFRFNLPDPLLLLLMVAGAYAVVRAIEKASVRWLVLAGVFIGFAFLTKMLQGFLVLPAFVLVYLVAAPTTLGRRFLHLGAAALAVVVSAGWFVALVELWPAASRPYIGGSTNNSLLELALGYNGFGRLSGGDGNPGGGMGGGMFGGSSGLGRLFGDSFGTEISWLLPAALIAFVAGLWFTRTAPRTDRTRAALLLWGGWLFVTGLVFSLMNGIVHPYYSVALAPAIAALVGIGGRELWRGRDHTPARVSLAAMVAVTGVWGFVLLHRTADWAPPLRWLVLVAAIVVATAIAVGVHQFRRVATVLAAATVLTTGLSAGAYGLATAAEAHTGSIPTSGPVSSDFGGGGGGPGGGMTTDSAMTAKLAATTTKWAAATEGAQQAAALELASDKAVIAIGGFSGGDPAPTLAQFQQWVKDGQVRYYVTGGMGGMGGRGSGSDIAQWVAANYQATTVGNATVYDLSS